MSPSSSAMSYVNPRRSSGRSRRSSPRTAISSPIPPRTPSSSRLRIRNPEDREAGRGPGRPDATGKGKINVYYLKHASSEDIAKVMQALVSRLPVPRRAARPNPLARPPSSRSGHYHADKLTNSLIIVASPIDYETMKDVIQKLDIRRRQVYVEAAIIEMG